MSGAQPRACTHWSRDPTRVPGDLERYQNRNLGPEAKQQLCYQNKASPWLQGWRRKGPGLRWGVSTQVMPRGHGA